MVIVLMVGGGIAVILLIVGIVISSSGERTLVDDRLNKYLEEDQNNSVTDKDSKGALTDWVNKRVEKSTFGERIARDLARADLKFKPGEYIALYVIAMVGGALIAYFAGGRLILSAFIGAVIGAFLPERRNG